MSEEHTVTWHERCACQSAAVTSQSWQATCLRLKATAANGFDELAPCTSHVHQYSFHAFSGRHAIYLCMGAFDALYNAGRRCQETLVHSCLPGTTGLLAAAAAAPEPTMPGGAGKGVQTTSRKMTAPLPLYP